MTSAGPGARPELGFDPDALREKYREEREKRLRPDGNEQYLEVAGVKLVTEVHRIGEGR